MEELVASQHTGMTRDEIKISFFDPAHSVNNMPVFDTEFLS